MGVNRMISVSFGADITTWGYLNYIKEYHFTGEFRSHVQQLWAILKDIFPN